MSNDAHDATTGCKRQRPRCWRNRSLLVDASIDTTGRQQGLMGLSAPPLMWPLARKGRPGRWWHLPWPPPKAEIVYTSVGGAGCDPQQCRPHQRVTKMEAAKLLASVTAAGISNNGSKWWARGLGNERGCHRHRNSLCQVTVASLVARLAAAMDASISGNGRRRHRLSTFAAADAMTFATWRRRLRWGPSASHPTRRSASRGSGGTWCGRCRRRQDNYECNNVGGGAVCTCHSQRAQDQVRRFVGVERTD